MTNPNHRRHSRTLILVIAMTCLPPAMSASGGQPAAKSAAATLSANQRAGATSRLEKLIPGFNGRRHPCSEALIHLVALSAKNEGNPDFRETLEAARAGMQMPPEYWQKRGTTNIFYGRKSVDDLVDVLAPFADKWCSALPTIRGNGDDGLKYISQMNWFFYKNQAGVYFAQGLSARGAHQPLVYDFLHEISVQSGEFMNSADSTGTIKAWVNDPRVEICDYQRPPGTPDDLRDEACTATTADKLYKYRSWNEFFTRRLKVDRQGSIVARPVTMPDRDYIISSPSDCIMNPLVQVITSGTHAGERNFIDNPLQPGTILDVKGIPVSVAELLTGVPEKIRQTFNEGTGLSCILMPATYHHFHAPVSGSVVYAALVKGPTYGYNDWPNLLPLNRNAAQAGTDFSQFEGYQRAVVVIKVTFKDAQGRDQTGYVASIPVGLSTVGSVVLNKDIIPSPRAAQTGSFPWVKRGVSEIGYFQYGGSLDLLLFSKGLADGSVQTRMGSQIGIINNH